MPSIEHYDYLFHYNHYNGTWNAFRRSQKEAYFNGGLKDEEKISSPNFSLVLDTVAITSRLQDRKEL